MKVPDKYATIQAALDEAVAGDTVAVNGVHHGNFVVDKAILFRGYTGTRITANVANQPVIRVTSPNAWVKRFVTVGGTQGVLVEAGNENVTVDFVTALQTSSAGIFLQPGCHNAKILKNVVNQTASGSGIIVSASDDVEVANNRVYTVANTAFLIANTQRCTLDGNLAFISNNGYSISGSGNEIIDNRAIRNNGYGFRVLGDNNEVFDNSSVANGSHGFTFSGSSNNLITENMSRFDDGSGFRILLGSDDNDVIGNTVRFGDKNGFLVQASSGNHLDDNWSDDNVNGFVFGSASSSTSVINNRSEDNDNFGILDLGTGNTFSGNISRRNGTN